MSFAAILCRLFGHKFTRDLGEYKRRCTRCRLEQWMFSKPFPQVGEPKYFWKDMTP